MNVANITSTPVAASYRRVVVPLQSPIEEKDDSANDDVAPEYTVRPEGREELRNLDDALLLVANLRTGILAKGRDALSAQANQNSTGLADLLR
jgi:hypothetical protein